MITVSYQVKGMLPSTRPYEVSREFYCKDNKSQLQGLVYGRLIVDGVTYDVPTDLGRDPICMICKHQIDCLEGSSRWLSFRPVE